MSAFDKYEQHKAGAVKAVTVDEWDGEVVYLREMDGATTAAYLSIKQDESEWSFSDYCKAIVLHWCDEDGNLLIAPEEREDAANELQGHKYVVISNLYVQSLRISGFAQESIEAEAGN